MANWWKEKAEWERDDTRIRIRKEFAEELIQHHNNLHCIEAGTESDWEREIRALAEGGE